VAFSYAHEDHIGGLPAILEIVHVRLLWTGATPESPEWVALRRKARELGVKNDPPEEGGAVSFGGADFQVLAPSAD
jgi:beta-lactamase superfamily II metal-dependent hydrolase